MSDLSQTALDMRKLEVSNTPSPSAETRKPRDIGAYSPAARRERLRRFLHKRKQRIWRKRVKYDVRKNFADSRLRFKGRFVKKEDEELMRAAMEIC